MNKKRMLRLADRLENIKPEKFDMSFFAINRECGTSHCIGGHALLMAGWKFSIQCHAFKNKNGTLLFNYGAGEVAQEYLGLTDKQAIKLFYRGTKRTPKDAARVIRNMVKNGK